MKEASSYKVSRVNQPIQIDGDWDKPQWQDIEAIQIKNYMGELPSFQPLAQTKMAYNDDHLFVIFQVSDRYVKSIVEDYNEPVSNDSCVEFFFAPDESLPEHYFNIEINAGGTPLMNYVTIPRKEYQKLTTEEIDQVEIAHSLPQKVDPEITEPITWTIEYKIPLTLLKKYSNVTQPKSGVIWKANFYKIAAKSSNTHFITWSYVDNPVPDFHLPKLFGSLIFN